MSEDDSKYKQYFEWARNELKQLTKWKIGIIKQLAEKLEAAGMPLEMTSSEIIRELNDYDVSERYIRSCLDDKYKDASKKRNKEIDVCGKNLTIEYLSRPILKKRGSRSDMKKQSTTVLI